MARWQIKEMSEKTGVSERMLRHFEKTGLLKPERYASNKYRSYSERDLAILQRIIALKSFGFSLKEIKGMLQKEDTILAHLKAQREVLRRKSEHVHEIYSTLSDVIARLGPWKTPDPNDLFMLIRRYQMTKDLKKSWAFKALNEEQFKAYVAIYEKNPEEFAQYDRMMEQINQNAFGDPEGPDGEKVIQFQLELIKKTRDTLSQQRHLGADVLKSMKAGRITDYQLNPEGALWLMRAGLAFWLKRWNKIYEDIVSSLSSDPNGQAGKKIADAWRNLIAEHMCVPPVDLAIGVMLWQELSRVQAESKDWKAIPAPQEMANKIHSKLLFNPDALSFLEKALLAHQ